MRFCDKHVKSCCRDVEGVAIILENDFSVYVGNQ